MAAPAQFVPLPGETYDSLRNYLGEESSNPDAIAKFVDEAVKDRLFEEAHRRATAATSHLSSE